MENIINLLIDEKEKQVALMDEEIYNDSRNENKQRDLTQKEIEKINKYRKNIFFIYEAIETIEKIEK